MFCIVCIVFLCCFIYVYLFLFVLTVLVLELLPPSDNSFAVNSNNNNNNNNNRKLNILQQIFEIYSNTKFHENPSSGSRVIHCRERDIYIYICIYMCVYIYIYIPPLQTGPGAHPVSCKMGTGSFPGVEAAGAWG